MQKKKVATAATVIKSATAMITTAADQWHEEKLQMRWRQQRQQQRWEQWRWEQQATRGNCNSNDKIDTNDNTDNNDWENKYYQRNENNDDVN